MALENAEHIELLQSGVIECERLGLDRDAVLEMVEVFFDSARRMRPVIEQKEPKG